MKGISHKKNYLFNIAIRVPAPCALLTSVYLSSLPAMPVMRPLFENVSDKLIHLACFAALCGAWVWWWPVNGLAARPLRRLLVTALAVSLYGALDEFRQSFVPGRESSALDWLADTAGAVLGAFAGLLTRLKSARLKPRPPSRRAG